MQGGNFISGAAGGFFGSLGAELWGGAMKNLGYENLHKVPLEPLPSGLYQVV